RVQRSERDARIRRTARAACRGAPADCAAPARGACRGSSQFCTRRGTGCRQPDPGASMMQRHPVEQIVADGHCIGCGFCTLAYEARTEGPRITMRYSPERDHWVPVVHDWQPGDDPGDVICPGRTMDMVGLAHAVHGHLPEDPVAGEVVSVRAGYAGDPAMRRQSASGGVTTALLAHLFEQGAIDVAYCAVPGEDPMQSCGRLVRSKAE